MLKTVAAIAFSPMLGFVLALLLVLTVSWSFVRSTPFAVDKTFRVAQLGSAALYSLGHTATKRSSDQTSRLRGKSSERQTRTALSQWPKPSARRRRQ